MFGLGKAASIQPCPACPPCRSFYPTLLLVSFLVVLATFFLLSSKNGKELLAKTWADLTPKEKKKPKPHITRTVNAKIKANGQVTGSRLPSRPHVRPPPPTPRPRALRR